MISVIGYGSLLSEQSARETVHELENFRLVEVPGFRRIFNKVGIVFFSRHGASETDLEIASCSTEACSEASIVCSQFECSEEAFLGLYEREHRFRWVEVETLGQRGERSLGRICTGYNDQDYRLNKCITDDEYQRRVGQFYSGALWRDDILPFPRYLAFCLQAASSQGEAVLDNFLDNSYLADGMTSIRHYLKSVPALADWHVMDTGYSYTRNNPPQR